MLLYRRLPESLVESKCFLLTQERSLFQSNPYIIRCPIRWSRLQFSHSHSLKLFVPSAICARSQFSKTTEFSKTVTYEIRLKLLTMIDSSLKKIERSRRLTDLEWPKSPAQNLLTPRTSHTNPRTLQSCHQNNNFRLIDSNVRNYSFSRSCCCYGKLLC